MNNKPMYYKIRRLLLHHNNSTDAPITHGYVEWSNKGCYSIQELLLEDQNAFAIVKEHKWYLKRKNI